MWGNVTSVEDDGKLDYESWLLDGGGLDGVFEGASV